MTCRVSCGDGSVTGPASPLSGRPRNQRRPRRTVLAASIEEHIDPMLPRWNPCVVVAGQELRTTLNPCHWDSGRSFFAVSDVWPRAKRCARSFTLLPSPDDNVIDWLTSKGNKVDHHSKTRLKHPRFVIRRIA